MASGPVATNFTSNASRGDAKTMSNTNFMGQFIPNVESGSLYGP